jgi:hypothetical protein
MQRFAAEEQEGVVRIPPVVRPAMVRVEPPSILIAFDVEHVRMAIGIREMCGAPPGTPPLDASSRG